MTLFTIVLKHPGGERQTMPVEYVASSMVLLTIRWNQSGLYDLDLRTNVLKAHSEAARRKGKPLWQAEDLAAVRKQAQEYLNAKRGNPKEIAKASYEAHAKRMPGAKKSG